MHKSIRLFFLLMVLMTCHVFAQQTVDGYTIPRLSPRPVTAKGAAPLQLLLSGKWNFRLMEGGQQGQINVPGEWAMQGYTVNEGETAVYTRKITIPVGWKGQRIKLRFDGVSSNAIVKINGVKAGEHEGGFVPFEMDITNLLKPTDNVLEVDVQAQTITDRLGRVSQYAAHIVGGILRKVTLFALPVQNIAVQDIATTFDKDFNDVVLKINTNLISEAGVATSAQMDYTLTDAVGKIVLHQLSTAASVDKTQTVVTSDLPVKHPHQWNPEHPCLYQLKSVLMVNGKATETITQKIGFRQVEVKGNQLLVNGKVVKLHGVNRHSIHPVTGRSVDVAFDRKDAILFRNANCNYIRTSHYPPTEEFLDAADELGLFVESEACLVWVTKGTAPIWKDWDVTDQRYLPYLMNASIENVIAGRAHPSIIMWSLANESGWSPFFAKVQEVVKALDPSRVTSFHDQCWGTANNQGSKTDIANFHYPGTHETAMADTMKRPVLFGEYAHISCYNRRELLSDPGIHSAYGKPLQQMYDSIYYHQGCLGGAVWAGIDDTFHMADGKIVGYGPWGIIDGWRRFKPEYWGVKKAYSPIRITKLDWSPTGKNITISLENRYDFTSLKDVGITAIINGKPQKISSKIAAHGSGNIETPATGVKALRLVFTDPRGFVADEEYFELAHQQATPVIKSERWNLNETDNAYLLKRGVVTYSISKRTGLIVSGRKNGREVLTQGPAFCMIPMNNDDGGKPGSVTYQNEIHPIKAYPSLVSFASKMTASQQGCGVIISANLVYSDSKAKVNYAFEADGKLKVNYELNYTKADISPYQYGLMMQLSKTFDKLTWDRQGEFSTYSADDQSRNAGVAMLNAKKTDGVEPWRIIPANNWKDDTNEMGSNDFRATKRDIKMSSLQDKQGNVVTVTGGAHQASRSWLQDGQINWLIADYFNNGSERFYATPFTNDRIKIAANTTIKGGLTMDIE